MLQEKELNFARLVPTIALFCIGVALILLRLGGSMRRHDRTAPCLANQRQIALSAQMLADEHGGSYPTASRLWKVMAKHPAGLRCPEADDDSLNSYGYNRYLENVDARRMPDPKTMIVSADCTGNCARQGGVLRNTRDIALRHAGKTVYSFTDGHVERGQRCALR